MMDIPRDKLNDEQGRMRAFVQTDALTFTSEGPFENITKLLQLVLDIEMVSINLITTDKQILTARQGFDLEETPREAAFCNIAIRKYEPLVIEDTHEDARVRNNPVVMGPPFLRSYIGAPLTTTDGYNLGAIAAFAATPRHFTAREVAIISQCAVLVMAEISLRSRASIDFLTGAFNRHSFASGLTREIARLHRQEGSSVVAFMDIDHFKQVNDNFGHPVGDIVLKEFADVVSGQCRANDLFARIGGEEFAVLLPDTDLDAAQVWAERMRERVAATRYNAANPLRLTVSVGLAELDETQTTSDAITTLADRALYAAKRGGRNRVVA